MPSPRVVVCGPSAWNHLIVLDRLPEPVPHMQFAERAWHTAGGTSAGKALHLADLGVDVRLRTPAGDDADGARLLAALEAAGVTVDRVASERTERHVNLMTDAGARVSLYVSTPTTPSSADVDAAALAVAEADIAIVDLSELGMLLVERSPATPLWIDLHDYDGSSAFHEPFVRAADVVFMNDDRTDDPWALMRSCLDRGPRLAVCTRGAEGAVALSASGERFEVAAAPATVVDTNGAGDAFMAGFLAATARGAAVDDALRAAAEQARIAIGSRHLHPALESAVGD
ncbi:carbohydrate kinase family protein [Microbacterium sp. JZ37]|uniref:carbohydrate kinase family protein n=1 Tax=Microbacterium sp. JZ37 TaxID=2654193 RepID=UPI002B48F8EF|nr:carbohydrate kinase family protein [Microbacterium sp. JZ37]WRH18794.1 carbohydrate kinase family protein [Microbacterium sp. JZ37]